MAGGWGLGSSAPSFCQDGARDFLEIDGKIGGEGVVAYLQSIRGRDKRISCMPPLL